MLELTLLSLSSLTLITHRQPQSRAAAWIREARRNMPTSAPTLGCVEPLFGLHRQQPQTWSQKSGHFLSNQALISLLHVNLHQRQHHLHDRSSRLSYIKSAEVPSTSYNVRSPVPACTMKIGRLGLERRLARKLTKNATNETSLLISESSDLLHRGAVRRRPGQ